MDLLVWVGIAACLVQAGTFSGLNLAVFGVSRLKLEAEAQTGDRDAIRVLALRKDSNLTLSTILWGNVAVNVLLTLLSDSILSGVGAFAFSTVVLTLGGEILPQAYFSRRALRVVSFLLPMLRFYRLLMYPVAMPTALFLDRWLGPEGIMYFREEGLREVIMRHIESEEAPDIDRLEGIGAINFLAIDDLVVTQEGEPVDPASVISLPVSSGRPVFPAFARVPDDPFLNRVHVSGKKWVIITNETGEPVMMLDSDGFLRGALFGGEPFNPFDFCHRPVIVKDMSASLGSVMPMLKVKSCGPGDDVIDLDAILLWGDEKRVITGADILGRLMRGIAGEEPGGGSCKPGANPYNNRPEV